MKDRRIVDEVDDCSTTTLKLTLPRRLVLELEALKAAEGEYEGLSFSDFLKAVLEAGLDSLDGDDPSDWDQ